MGKRSERAIWVARGSTFTGAGQRECDNPTVSSHVEVLGLCIQLPRGSLRLERADKQVVVLIADPQHSIVLKVAPEAKDIDSGQVSILASQVVPLAVPTPPEVGPSKLGRRYCYGRRRSFDPP
jgi:hypothetical protein